LQGAGQRAAHQRAPRDQPQAVFAAGWDDFQFDHALADVVQALFRHQAEEVARAGSLHRLGNIPPGEIAAADVDDLALLDEYFHGLPDLLPRCFAVDVVHLVQIDVVGFQPAQAFVARGADVISGEFHLVGPLAHAPVDFGGQHHFFAPPAALRKPAADDVLGDAFAQLPTIHVGRVEKVDPQIQRGVHDTEAVFFAGVRSEVHRSKAQPADL